MLEPAKTVSLFQKQPEQKIFAPGDKIFEDGEEGNIMYGIVEGVVELFVNGQVIETIKTGDVFGEGALVHEDHTRASTAIAKTGCTLAYLDQERFLFAVQETPMFALYVIRSYSDRLRRLKLSL
ncbi:MAG: cyclic nucleotide-binding domain-containing protein [Okeania sp. SIO3I5]|uniref:cyclic nucleotide-binding domain-containing protein n=1 Tax=Okeania sp. SIO3I5 TaxID=2607805 RepID=UPI0013B6804D|nr:cyclic nucleotide-binding domain-containing protein [Okeania sp. SIO3I5]NEQ38003.1 cyclic nucleotide-binding domain-containing protein [Okeania sp. SIO3I5]